MLVILSSHIYLIADLLHSEIQFYEAGWSVVFDVDPEQARKSREGIYPTLAKPNVIVADGHFANQVFGRLTHEGAKWVWTPLK